MGKLIGQIIGRLVFGVLFGWLISAGLSLLQRLIAWLELDAHPSEMPWRWALPKIALTAAVVLLLVAILYLALRTVTGA